MGKVIQAVVLCFLLGSVYGAPADSTDNQDAASFQLKTKFVEKFDDEGQTFIETLEETDYGNIIDVESQEGSSALKVLKDKTHGLLLHRFDADGTCYISSLAEYKDKRSEQENPSSLFEYRLEPISKINRQYFNYTATDSMKRVCSGAENLFWSEIHADNKQEETRQKRFCFPRPRKYCSKYDEDGDCIERDYTWDIQCIFKF